MRRRVARAQPLATVWGRFWPSRPARAGSAVLIRALEVARGRGRLPVSQPLANLRLRHALLDRPPYGAGVAQIMHPRFHVGLVDGATPGGLEGIPIAE